MSRRDTYIQIYTVCGGLWVKRTNLPDDTKIPANQKLLMNTNNGNNRLGDFYLKTNIAYPSKQTCVGIQFVLFSISVKNQELSEADQDRCEVLYDKATGVLPPYIGVRPKLIILSNENEESLFMKQGDIMAPNNGYLFKKIREIVKHLKSAGIFDARDFRQNAKSWIENHLKFQYQSMRTYQPIELTKQTLKLMLKTIQDLVNKKE